ncbi:mitochondrial ribosome-associated GTPase 2 [Galendromus occidentalis]|uniref:Mitochondrial ribosome-associated GTPase 2 n=1 Tax=Galendromus occidentalis TaxID=34638 RepID=A0AAJ7L4S9_9ACAR|nr:mitochondrial ribosome-associated GTPase 2 [Galendromus occidentalis]
MLGRPSIIFRPAAQLVRCLCTPVALESLKAKSAHDRKNTFSDWKKVRTVGGNGGRGCISFMHLFSNPDAGPDGGDGGNGGHVLLQAEPTVNSLGNVPSTRISAWDGQPGLGKNCHGAKGEHVIVPVPVGTIVRKEDGTFLADLSVPGMMFLASRGGAGGRGNNYYLSNENRHPQICQIGAPGEVRTYTLEMKTMAHAGMVGFPNAGKSTLLQAISRAKPKVAAYPFTTLRPHVGIIEYDDYEQVAVADLPGIIKGAHENRGLGIDFLRHAERCGCLLYVVDVGADDYEEQLKVLQDELECYRKGFCERISIIVANKIDLLEEAELNERVRRLASQWDMPVVPISAKFGTNVTALLKYLRRSYDEVRARLPAPVSDVIVGE